MSKGNQATWDLFVLYQKFYKTLYAATRLLPDGSRQVVDLFDEKALDRVTRELADVLESAFRQRIEKGESDPRLTAAIGKAMQEIAFPLERHNKHPNVKCRYITHDIIPTDQIESLDSVNKLLNLLKEEGVNMIFPTKDEDIKIVAFHLAPKPQSLAYTKQQENDKSLPRDLITLEVAVAKFQISRATIKRLIGDNKITSYRPPNSPKNAKHFVSESEVGKYYLRKP